MVRDLIDPDAFDLEPDATEATDGTWTVKVVPRDGESVKLYRRYAYRPFVQPPIKARALVAELDGTRLYAIGNMLILTRKKLM